jgi:hypothetical protein
MRIRFPVLSCLAITLVAIGATLVSMRARAVSSPKNLASLAEDDLCANDHELNFTLSHRIRDYISPTSLTEETVSTVERALDKARLQCADSLNIADAAFLAGLYGMLGDRTLATGRYSDSARELAAAIAIISRIPGPNLTLLWALEGQIQAEFGIGDRKAADALMQELERLVRDWARSKRIPNSELKRALELMARMNDKEGNHAAAEALLKEARTTNEGN